jgi:hypothetical protein
MCAQGVRESGPAGKAEGVTSEWDGAPPLACAGAQLTSGAASRYQSAIFRSLGMPWAGRWGPFGVNVLPYHAANQYR